MKAAWRVCCAVLALSGCTSDDSVGSEIDGAGGGGSNVPGDDDGVGNADDDTGTNLDDDST